MAIEGGGGSVAVQYANGGTMNGDLNVTGKYLSGGVDLSTLIGSGGGGISLSGYTDRLVSGSEVFKLNTDGTFNFPNNIITPQDEVILTLESTKLLDNYYNRLALSPYGFFASDHNENSITIDSTTNNILIDSQDQYHWKFNSVGEMEGPFGTLSVNGNVSASEVVYASGGNSNVWNSLNSTVVSTSAKWDNPRTLYALVYNADTVRLERGNVVYSFGANGDVMSVKRASNTSDATSSKTLGFVTNPIEVGATGYVTVQGRIEQMDFGLPFVQGDTLWLGTVAGSYVRGEPLSPLHAVYLGVVERANQGNGIAYVKVQNGYKLSESHDVLITSVSAGQILRRNNTNNLWINTNDGINWDSTYTTVQQNSATTWNYQGTDLKLLSSGWIGGNSAYTTVWTNSARWTSSYTKVNSNSANWDSTYTTVWSNSASWAIDSTIDTGVRALTSNWDSTYTTVQNNSATTWNYQGSDLKALSGNWQNTYLNQTNYLPLTGGTITGSLSVIGTSTVNGVVQLGSISNPTTTLYVDTSKVGINTENPNEELTVVGDISATGKIYGDGSGLTGIAAGGSYLPLSGGNLTGEITTTSTISSTNNIYANNERVIVGESTDTTPVYKIRAITQAEYAAIAIKDDNTIYFIKQ
jgi:hypothetical protein